MDIKNCGRKLAVITSRRHHDGGFEAVVPADTLWSVDPDRNPDARLFLLDAMRRNADVAVIDEDGSAHPDVLYPDLVAFKQDLRDARAEMQIIVIASEERFEPGDPYLSQLIGCGVYDIISEKDPRTLDRALGDLMASPTTAQQAAELAGSARPKGFFGLRRPRKKQKRGQKAAAAEPAPTIATSMEPAQAAQGRKPLTSAPSETAKVLQKLQGTGEIPAARPEPAPAPEPPAQAPSPVPTQHAQGAPAAAAPAAEPATQGAAPAACAQAPSAPQEPTAPEPAGDDRPAGQDRGGGNAPLPEPAAEPPRPEPQPAPAPDPRPHTAPAETAGRARAPLPADPRRSIMTPDQVQLMETVRAAVAKEYEAREAALRREYDLKLGSAMRQGRRQRCVAVCSLVPAMTAEAAMEAAAFCKRALPGATAAFVEHDGARLGILEPYGAIAPGSGDAMPDIVVRDFGQDWRAAAEAEADARLLVLAPEPWEAGAQKDAFAAGAGAGMTACLPADGPMAERIALAITGDRAALALPDPNHFAAGPGAAPEAYQAALGEMVSLLASEMGAAARPAPAEPERAPEPPAAEPGTPARPEQAGARGVPAAEDAAAEPPTAPAPAGADAADAPGSAADGGDPGEKGGQAPAAPPAPEPSRRRPSRGVSWVCFDTGEADGPYDLDSQPEGWLDEMRARHPEEGQWVEIGEYEEAGGGLRWKSLAQVRNETAQVKGKAERVAAKRRAKQARA